MRGTALLAALLAAACSRGRGSATESAAEVPAEIPAVVAPATPQTEGGLPGSSAVAPELAAAQAVVDDGFQVTADRPVRVDGAVTARLIDAVRGDETMVMWVDANYSPGSRLAVRHGRRIGVSGVVDLYQTRQLPSGYHAANGSTTGMKHPLLVVRVETAEDVSDDEELARSRRKTGTRITETLQLFDLRANRFVFQHDVRVASGDGFGGFDVAGLAIEVSGETVRLKGTRQDRLPASRARCMRPPPVALVFDWTGSVFERSRAGEPIAVARGRGC